MRVVDVPENNLTLSAPSSWDEERHGPCETIRCLRDSDGFTLTLELEADEFAGLLKGGKLKLRIFGNGFPPVSLWVE